MKNAFRMYRGYKIYKVDNSEYAEEVGLRPKDLIYYYIEAIDDGSPDEGHDKLWQAKRVIDNVIAEKEGILK